MFTVQYSPGYPKSSYKLQKYVGAGTSSVVESNQRWDTRQEAQAVCDRVNSGNEEGVTFGLFADD